MDDLARSRIGEWLHAFPEVEWDRMAGDERWLTVFGWIAREDGRSDFLVLTFSYPATKHETLSIITSSAALSRAFSERIGVSDHRDCERVADVLGDFAPKGGGEWPVPSAGL